MKINYKTYDIELIDDSIYSVKSTANKINYRFEYFGGEINQRRIYPLNKRGIIVKKANSMKEISSAILLENGGKSPISDQVFKLEEDKIWISIGDKIYSLTIPDLNISSFTEMECGTVLSINFYKEDFLVLGELGASRISKSGQAKWFFKAQSIFLANKDGIKITDSHIELIDANNQKYVIDENGKE